MPELAESPRRLGNSDLFVSPIAMGCWPIAGVTSVDVNDADSADTLRAAFDSGIDFFDTAFCYGYEGESERLIGATLGPVRDRIVIATKGGLHWQEKRQVRDASPARLRAECEESLRRLGTDRVDLLYLHAPDPRVPLAESAGELRRLRDEGKTCAVGVSNLDVTQLEEFVAECPIAAFQPPFNMLQRDIEDDRLPWCVERNVAVVIYWPLMKGLLAGHLARDHVFDPKDGRPKYPIFQGEDWERNQDFVDRLRLIATRLGKSVPQIVLNWTIQQPGITVALAGAKRDYQIRDNAGGMGWRLSEVDLGEIDQAIAARGPTAARPPI
ncbi:MAG TPA: aldo/keto reductase [Planctomycetia bacterium]|nr:aldo/keto reductase [Planctomycetia bacterium]